MRFDPAAVYVGAVERAAVVEVVLAAAADQDRVIARDRHVVQEDVRYGTATDGHPPGAEREALPRASAPGADHQRRSPLDDIVQLDLLELTRLAQLVGRRRRPRRRIGVGQERTTPLAVVSALVVGKTALWAVLSQSRRLRLF